MKLSKPRFLLEFPARAEDVSTARIFGAAIARHFGCDETEIDDLKIALSEACANAVRGTDSVEPVRVIVSVEGDDLAFEVEGGGWEARKEGILQNDELPTGEHAASLGVELIMTLFPDARVVEGPTGSSLRFAVKPGTAA